MLNLRPKKAESQLPDSPVSPYPLVFAIKFQKLSEAGRIPERSSLYAAAFDLYSAEYVEVGPGEIIPVKTDIAVELPAGYWALIKERSSMALKDGVVVTAGVIDNDYRGEIKVLLFNTTSDRPYPVHPGMRIGQLIPLPFYSGVAVEAHQLAETARGVNGFGSTGR